MKTIFREYWAVLWSRKKSFFGMIAFILIANGVYLIARLFYRDLANILAGEFTEQTGELALSTLLFVLYSHIVIWVSWRGLEYLILHCQVGGMNSLSKRAFTVIQRQRYDFFQNEFSGSIVKKASRFVRSFEVMTDWILFQGISNLSLILGACAIFSFHQPLLAIYFGIFVTVFLLFSTVFSFVQFRYHAISAEMDSKISGVFADSFSNIFTVKTAGKEQEEQDIHRNVSDMWEKKTRFAWSITFVGFAIQGIIWIIFEIFLTYLMIQKWKTGDFSIGEFVLFQSIFFYVIHKLWEFGRSLRTLFSALADAKEMAEIIEKNRVECDRKGAKDFDILKGSIAFKNISFGYEGEVLFQDFCLDIAAGEKVALVGESGSGKTTITKLLFRFHDIDSGSICFDGMNQEHITLRSLRSQISLVPQRPELFHRSIRENLVFAKKDATDREINNALQKARAFDFVNALPKGIDTLVGERGVKLSGGEAQRIAIARAFLENSPIVVLDEATSALDSVTEQQIQEGVFDLISDKTAIVIAHRLSTILHMDRIIVMEKGKIIEMGTHEELTARQGKYAEMWKHQSGGILVN